jgi:hypothetical protein
MNTLEHHQKLYYLTEQDVRDAVFHWLATVHQIVPTAKDKAAITAGSVNAVTIQILSPMVK